MENLRTWICLRKSEIDLLVPWGNRQQNWRNSWSAISTGNHFTLLVYFFFFRSNLNTTFYFKKYWRKKCFGYKRWLIYSRSGLHVYCWLLIVVACCSDRSIPVANMDLHFAHCSRNLEKCKVCGDMIPQKFAEEHFMTTHAPVCFIN